MHYDENEHRHPHHREMRHRRDRAMHPHQHPHFQDFSNRWGEPEPLIHLNHQDRHPHDRDYLENTDFRRQHDEDWHDPRHNRYQQQHQEPAWRQRDVHFDRSNQRVEDRWFENDSPMMPGPQHRENWRRRRHDRDEYWDENEY